MAHNRYGKIENSNPFGNRPAPSFDELTGSMVNGTPEVVERVVEKVVEVEKEVVVHVPRPIAKDEHGVVHIGNVGLTSLGLVMPDSDISESEWAALFEVLQETRKSWQFLIGDWFAYGVDKFKYSYAQIAEWTGYKESTVETFASVCRNVERLTRINSLSFAHHRAVSTLTSEQQSAALIYAETEGLSARELAAAIQGKKALRSGAKKAQKTPRAIVDKVAFNQLKKADEKRRQKAAAELRRLADELERGG